MDLDIQCLLLALVVLKVVGREGLTAAEGLLDAPGELRIQAVPEELVEARSAFITSEVLLTIFCRS